jgi:hypothetical protein
MNLSKIISLFLPQVVVWGNRYVKRKIKRTNLYSFLTNKHKYYVLQRNKVLVGKYLGERCFIVGTGFSIENTNVYLLRDEKKIFMSQFFLHKEYNDLNPEYHLFNSYGGHPYLDKKVILEHYSQIDEMIQPNTNLFFRYTRDYDFIQQYGLFKNKRVYYLEYGSSISYLPKDGLNITKYLYSPRGCLALAIQLALCMGFKKIYLVGCDGRALKADGRSHFYKREESTIDHNAEKHLEDRLDKLDGKYDPTFYSGCDTLSGSYKLGQSIVENFYYHNVLKSYARSVNATIYNATPNSFLDVYSYIELESLFK